MEGHGLNDSPQSSVRRLKTPTRSKTPNSRSESRRQSASQSQRRGGSEEEKGDKKIEKTTNKPRKLPNGVLKEGRLGKQGGWLFASSWNIRFFRLTANTLSYYRSVDEAPRWQIPLKGATVQLETDPKKSHVFSVTPHNATRKYFMHGVSARDTQSWIDAINQQTERHRMREGLKRKEIQRHVLAHHTTEQEPQSSHSSHELNTVSTGDQLPFEDTVEVEEPQVLHQDDDTVEELRAWMKHSLPDYMVPTYLVFMNHFPMTPNGKVDLKKLPLPKWNLSKHTNGITAPRSPLEEQLCELWAEILGLSVVGVQDNFFELGGNSLIASKLLAAMNEAISIKLTVPLLFDSPTVAGVAAKITNLRGDSGSQGGMAALSVTPAVDVVKETTLPTELTEAISKVLSFSADTPQLKLSQVKHVFLTGVTGFLGAFLLDALLRLTNEAVIHVLCRGKDIKICEQRVWKNYGNYGLLSSESKGVEKETAADKRARKRAAQKKDLSEKRKRVRVIKGDLGAKCLGMQEREFEHLGSKLDLIIHCGALVNSVLPYDQLKQPNVGGTLECLRLAAQGERPSAYHQVSTLSVFHGQTKDGKFYETSPLTALTKAHEGYAVTKWVADVVVMKAGELGMPVAVHRPGRVTGHSKTGYASTEDFMTRFFKGCLQMGVAPDLDWMCDMTPVDYVADGIVYLALDPPPFSPPTPSTPTKEKRFTPTSRVFHMCQPSPFHLERVVDWLNSSFGYMIRTLSYKRWRAELLAKVEDEVDEEQKDQNALAPMISLFAENKKDMGSHKTIPSFDTTKTEQAIIQAGGKGCPRVTTKLLKTYFQYYVRCGYLPNPNE